MDKATFLTQKLIEAFEKSDEVYITAYETESKSRILSRSKCEKVNEIIRTLADFKFTLIALD